MASGKSLELAQLKKAEPRPVCICGLDWAAHLRKDGEVLVKYQNDKHKPKGISKGYNRKQMRRAMRHG